MKKVLLGTTALVSAGLVAQQAQAADPIQLNVGGYQNWATFWTSNDNNPATGTLPAQPGFNRYDNRIVFDGEIQFKGKTVLDNGLEVGVRFELEGEQQGGDQMDETYAFIKGSFGEFRVGNDDPAAYTMSTAAPYLNYLFAANSPTVFTNGLSQFFSATGRTAVGAGYATFATFPGMTGDDGSFMYFTPVFNGFQLGASYSPDQGEARQGLGYNLGTRTRNNLGAPALAEEWSVAGRYDGEIGEIGLTVALGYMEAASRAGGNAVGQSADFEAMNAGLVLYWGNWGIGGSYMDAENMRGFAGTDMQSYDLGVAYWSDGAWSAGVYWLHSEIDYSAASSATLPGPIAAGGGSVEDEFDAYRLQGAYKLGPGISLTGALGWDTFEDGATGTDYDSKFIGAGMLLSF
jgi:outer membrane protein OmpU